ncbi:hypothetical protein PsorP6_000874 [Peronosclerospora sorghi]|uniref:Uncharacterized protein n=1 Tax=Peronosclerospora sorghi TaxID=230839 RepID=A0ACC0WXR7_9STRA|nr:hypothetical protein PsorP6_000874 [Peronosclerospora sorghi]
MLLNAFLRLMSVGDLHRMQALRCDIGKYAASKTDEIVEPVLVKLLERQKLAEDDVMDTSSVDSRTL